MLFFWPFLHFLSDTVGHWQGLICSGDVVCPEFVLAFKSNLIIQVEHSGHEFDAALFLLIRRFVLIIWPSFLLLAFGILSYGLCSSWLYKFWCRCRAYLVICCLPCFSCT